MIREKIAQAISILKEKNIDMWLTFLRESSTTHDPALDLIFGSSCTWQTAFIITSTGKTIAIAGTLDIANINSTGLYNEVIGYVDSIKEPLLNILKRESPEKIAINTSQNDVMADGLTHGMYNILTGYLKEINFDDKLISSEEIISALRGRKSMSEIKAIESAIIETEKIFEKVNDYIKPGLTEKQIADFILNEVEKADLKTAWEKETCPAVFTGPESAGAHAGPTGRKIEPGHILNIDFGVKKNGYCSDLQRTWYFLKHGEDKAPEEVQKAFDIIKEAVERSRQSIKPGIEGGKIDDVARNYITSHGFKEFQHGLGHQIGKSTHDGAGLLCPRWERYGNLPYLKIEEGQVYTLEPRIILDGYGVVTLEDIVVVEKNGARYLSHPQKELWLINSV